MGPDARQQQARRALGLHAKESLVSLGTGQRLSAGPWAAIWHCHLTPPGTSLSSWQHDRRDVALGTSAALNIEAKGNVSPTAPVLRAPGITQAEAHSPGTSHIGDRGGAPPALPGQPQPPAGPWASFLVGWHRTGGARAPVGCPWLRSPACDLSLAWSR